MGFLESTPLVPIELDAENGRVRYVGPQAVELLGHPLGAWYDPGFWTSSVVPDDQVTIGDARRNSIEGKGRHAIDYRVETDDGRVLWICELLRYVDGPEGPGLRGFLWDVSDRKRQEVALWRNEERLRTLLRKAPDAMVLTDREGRVLNMNDQAEALFDYRLSDIVGSRIDHLLPEPVRPRIARLRAAFDRDPARKSLVDGHSFSIQRSDGNQVPVELGLSLVSGEDDEGHLLWSARDLTVRRRVEAARRRATAEPETGSSCPTPPACSISVDGRYDFVNEAYASCYGAGPSELEGRSVREVVGERLFSLLEPSIGLALEGTATHLRSEITDGSGCPLPVDVTLAPRHEGERRVTGCVLVMLPRPAGTEARPA